jgi:hypothetical protein
VQVSVEMQVPYMTALVLAEVKVVHCLKNDIFGRILKLEYL